MDRVVKPNHVGGGLEQRKSEKGSLLFLMEGIQSSHCLMKS